MAQRRRYKRNDETGSDEGTYIPLPVIVAGLILLVLFVALPGWMMTIGGEKGLFSFSTTTYTIPLEVETPPAAANPQPTAWAMATPPPTASKPTPIPTRAPIPTATPQPQIAGAILEGPDLLAGYSNQITIDNAPSNPPGYQAAPAAPAVPQPAVPSSASCSLKSFTLNSPSRKGCQQGNLAWGWSALDAAAKQKGVPTVTLAFLWYIESGCARTNGNTNGVFQNHSAGVTAGAAVSLQELQRQAGMAANHLLKTARERKATLSYAMNPTSQALVDQVMLYNGPGYGWPTSNSPYISGEPGQNREFYVSSGVKQMATITFYGYLPFLRYISVQCQ